MWGTVHPTENRVLHAHTIFKCPAVQWWWKIGSLYVSVRSSYLRLFIYKHNVFCIVLLYTKFWGCNHWAKQDCIPLNSELFQKLYSFPESSITLRGITFMVRLQMAKAFDDFFVPFRVVMWCIFTLTCVLFHSKSLSFHWSITLWLSHYISFELWM